jgi:hypothetical protein
MSAQAANTKLMLAERSETLAMVFLLSEERRQNSTPAQIIAPAARRAVRKKQKPG